MTGAAERPAGVRGDRQERAQRLAALLAARTMMTPQLIAAIGSNASAFSNLAGSAPQLSSAAQSLQSMDTHSLVASASAAGLMSGSVAAGGARPPAGVRGNCRQPVGLCRCHASNQRPWRRGGASESLRGYRGPAEPVCADLEPRLRSGA